MLGLFFFTIPNPNWDKRGSEYKLQTGLHRPIARGIGHDAK
jgi:hypothetical protein